MTSDLRVTFLGHSTALVEVGGVRILTDPVLMDGVGPLRRVVEPLTPDLYASIDVVVLSHLHLDHFDVPSLRLLGSGQSIIVPSGAEPLLARLGFTAVHGLAAGGHLHERTVAITAIPAVHGGYRPPFGPRVPALGYTIDGASARVYFSGDTDCFGGMTALAPVDVALLPVWGWGPSLGRGHMDPARAAHAAALLQARVVIPIHWGTLWPRGLGRVRRRRLTDPPHELAAKARQRSPRTRVVIVQPGETVDLGTESRFARRRPT